MRRDSWKSHFVIGIIVVAVGGYLLMYLSGQIIEMVTKFRQTYEQNPILGYICVAMSAIGMGAVVAAVVLLCLWLHRKDRLKQKQKLLQSGNIAEMTEEEKKEAVAKNIEEAGDISRGLVGEAGGENIQKKIVELAEKLESQKLELSFFGTISSGKSSVINALAGREVVNTDPCGGTTVQRNNIPWPGQDNIVLVDTPGLGEVDGKDREKIAVEAARDSDLVVFVIDGPLKDFEFKMLEILTRLDKKVIVCLNKEDWFTADNKALLLGQIGEQLKGLLSAQDLVTVRARTVQRTRMRVQLDGTEKEEIAELPADIAELVKRMLEIVEKKGKELLLANLVLRSQGLVGEAKKTVHAILDKRAWEIVEKYMWATGAATALCPLPLFDIVVGSGLTLKMAVDLAGLYRQEIKLSDLKELLGNLGKNFVAIGGINLTTPFIASKIGSMIKSIPGAGTIAGGIIQYVSQALITKWIGRVLIEYFRGQMAEPQEGFSTMAEQCWTRITQHQELAQLVKEGISRFGKEKQK